jgi:hypothetical protein
MREILKEKLPTKLIARAAKVSVRMVELVIKGDKKSQKVSYVISEYIRYSDVTEKLLTKKAEEFDKEDSK